MSCPFPAPCWDTSSCPLTVPGTFPPCHSPGTEFCPLFQEGLLNAISLLKDCKNDSVNKDTEPPYTAHHNVFVDTIKCPRSSVAPDAVCFLLYNNFCDSSLTITPISCDGCELSTAPGGGTPRHSQPSHFCSSSPASLLWGA